ncbi:MAG: hypothetical protein KF819_40070, partial [Labilithrix sp.]|nr:hypothetical protein [Labilithrix sp.]
GLVLRTRGVHTHDHPELEIIRVPQAGANAAADLINDLLSSVVDVGKALLAGERWGGALRVRSDDPHRELAVALVARQAPEPGVLGLFDFYPEDATNAHQSIATMMVHQANRLVAGGEVAAAAALLRESIAIFPGAHLAGAPPELDLQGDLNWQNHLAYLRLAEITPDPAESEHLLQEVHTRVEWLAERDLGGTVAAVRAALGVHDFSSMVRLAREILDHNVASPHAKHGPHEGVLLVASPLWSRGESGQAVRRFRLLPAGFAVMYLGEHLADPETADLVARRTYQLIEQHGARPWELAKHTALARNDCVGEGTLVVDAGRPYELVHFIVSACVATATREFYAAARGDEFEAWLANEHARAAASEPAQSRD